MLAASTPRWIPHLDVWVVLGGVAVLYFTALIRWAPIERPEHISQVWPRRQQLLCAVALFVLWAGSDWPIHDVAEQRMYSVHMVQHLLFTQIAPALLLLGTPGWFIRRLLTKARATHLVRYIARFFPALILHSLVVAVIHIPWVVNTALDVGWFHFVAHVVLFGTALLVWLPVVSTTSFIPRLSPLPRMLFVFLMGVMPTLPATWLGYADSPVYSGYAKRPKMWGWSALDDQQIAALIMKTAAGAIGFLLIAVIFFRWAGIEERRSRTEGLPAWQDRPRTA